MPCALRLATEWARGKEERSGSVQAMYRPAGSLQCGHACNFPGAAVDSSQRRYLGPCLAELKQKLHPFEKLMPVDQAEFGRLSKLASQRAQLIALEPVPYHLRHSGAAGDERRC